MDEHADHVESEQRAGAADTSGRLSRADAASRLGVSTRTLARLEAEGRVVPVRDDQGRVWFDDDAVEKLVLERSQARRPDEEGARAQRAFAILRAGGDARRLVEELAIAPPEARRLFAEWASLGDCIAVEPERARRIAALLGATRFDLATIERVLQGTSRLARVLAAPCCECGCSRPHERRAALEAEWTCADCAQEG